MQYIQNISLDVNCNPTNYQYINAKQCDNASRVLNITLTSNNQQIKPETGTEAVFRCLKPDGNSCVNPAVINADGTVTVEFTKQELAVKGVTLADISLIKNETTLSTVSFRILVDEAPVSVSKVNSSGEFLILLDTIRAAETAIEKATIATNEAINATEAAIMARQDSDSSTAAANKAVDSVNAAKIEAEEAAQKANIAANLANSAAESVDNAKENANNAANNANAAAERVEKAVQATETVINEANTASENAQNITELLTEKLNNGEFIGAKGEKGDDGFSPIVTVTSSDNGHNVTITDSTGDKSFDVFNGEQGIPGADGKDYILTESDKKDIADLAVENAAEAANNANSAAQAAKDLVEEVNTKLTNGEFDGADYILTSSDKIEIAKLVEPIADNIGGGLLAYKIPDKYWHVKSDAYHPLMPSSQVVAYYVSLGTLTVKVPEEDMDEYEYLEENSNTPEGFDKLIDFEKSHMSEVSYPWDFPHEKSWVDIYLQWYKNTNDSYHTSTSFDLGTPQDYFNGYFDIICNISNGLNNGCAENKFSLNSSIACPFDVIGLSEDTEDYSEYEYDGEELICKSINAKVDICLIRYLSLYLTPSGAEATHYNLANCSGVTLVKSTNNPPVEEYENDEITS